MVTDKQTDVYDSETCWDYCLTLITNEVNQMCKLITLLQIYHFISMLSEREKKLENSSPM